MVERVDARGNYLVGVVLSIEGDGGARPAEVLGHRHSCREDLTTFPLALPHGQLCRGPTIDHVAIVDGWETVVVLVVLLVAALFLLWVVTRVLLEPQTVEMLF